MKQFLALCVVLLLTVVFVPKANAQEFQLPEFPVIEIPDVCSLIPELCQITPTISPEPSIEPSIAPSGEPSIAPSQEVTPDPTATPTPAGGSGVSDGRSDGRSDGLCSKPPCNNSGVIPQAPPATGHSQN